MNKKSLHLAGSFPWIAVVLPGGGGASARLLVKKLASVIKKSKQTQICKLVTFIATEKKIVILENSNSIIFN